MNATLTTVLAIGVWSVGAMQAAAQTKAPMGAERRAHVPIVAETTVVGARLGVTDVDNLSGLVFSYGAYGDRAIADNFLVGGTLDYWSQTSSDLGFERVQVSDLAVGANSKFIFTNVRAPVRPFVGAGLALHRLAVNVSEEKTSTGPEVSRFKDVNSDVSGELGIDIGGGVLYRIQPDLDVAGEIKWRKLTDPKVDFDQMSFTGALAYNM